MQVGNILISSDLITECFCCDLDACKGACCIEGDAGAPVTLDEIAAMEDHLDIVWNDFASVRSIEHIVPGSVRFANPYPVHFIPFAKSVSMTTL